ncbi:MAG: hypothetical protein KatS3mg021_2768 [Fimbriimonadales bacterium]|jgi:hypothetical protein|nr:MAG: hypothetical protein KatS3mg021_2768 [Fimbriimonadales bacterium]
MVPAAYGADAGAVLMPGRGVCINIGDPFA